MKNLNFFGILKIKKLLKKCSQIDVSPQEFPIPKHGYKLNPPIEVKDVKSIEKKYGFTLPKEYFWFITKVGNGGAGPYSQLYSFDIKKTSKYKKLSKPSSITLDHSKNFFNDILKKNERSIYNPLNEDIKISDQGILPIGSEGSNYTIMLIVSGKNKGRVVYLGPKGKNFYFPYVNNFLEWYTLWLVETSSNYDMSFYGSRMAGNEMDLIGALRDYIDKKDTKNNLSYFKENYYKELLFSLFKFPSISNDSSKLLYKLYCDEVYREPKKILLKLLIKFNYTLVEDIIKDGLHYGDTSKFISYIIKYQKGNYDYWYKEVVKVLSKLPPTDLNTTYLLYCTKCTCVDIQDILKLLKNENRKIRYYTLSNLQRFCNPNDFIDEILPLFNDDIELIRKAVDLLKDSKDMRLCSIYERLIAKYYLTPKEEDKYMFSCIKNFYERNNIDFNLIVKKYL